MSKVPSAPDLPPRSWWSRWWTTVGTVMLFATVAAIIAPALMRERENARKVESKNNLKQIGLALHNYHDSFNVLPPGGVVGLPNQTQHGWQIMILPQIESSPWYNMVDFKRPWNSPRNAPVFRIPFSPYTSPGVSEVTDEDGYTLTHFAGSSKLFGVNQSTRLHDLKKEDLNHTILAGEVGENYQAWGRPGNTRDPDVPLNSGPNAFGRYSRDGAFLCMADGSVRFVSNSVDPGILKSAASSNRPHPVYKLSYRELRSKLLAQVQSNDRNQEVALWVPWSLVKGDHLEHSLTDDDFRYLAKLRDLEFLSIYGNAYTDAGLAHLQDNKQLQALDIFCDAITDSGLEHLRRLSKLKTLNIRSKHVTEVGINGLRRALPECDISWKD